MRLSRLEGKAQPFALVLDEPGKISASKGMMLLGFRRIRVVTVWELSIGENYIVEYRAQSSLLDGLGLPLLDSGRKAPPPPPGLLRHRLSLVKQECQIEWPPPLDFVVINVTGGEIVRGSLGRISLRVMAFAAFPDGGHEHVDGLRTSSRERVTCGAVFPIG